MQIVTSINYAHVLRHGFRVASKLKLSDQKPRPPDTKPVQRGLASVIKAGPLQLGIVRNTGITCNANYKGRHLIT